MEKKLLNDALINLLTGKTLPLNLVDNELFKYFVKLLDPRLVQMCYSKTYYVNMQKCL